MKKRILSAIIMIAIFIPLLILGGKAFSIFMALLAMCGLHELIKAKESKKNLPFMMKVFSYILVLVFSLNNFDSIEYVYNLDYRIMSLIIFLFLSPLVFINNSKKYSINDALYLIGSTLFIGLSFNLIIITRNADINFIIYLLLITTITDTFALFTGMLIGKNKLAPSISPKKTVEGLVGGVLMGTIAATCFYHIAIAPATPLVIVILVTTVLALVGQLGDLIFSSIKRYYGVKDFANLIPGHGGILDRFDSLIFVILAYILLSIFI